MNADRQSDEPVVPATSANNDDADPSAEQSKERGSTKRKVEPANLDQTQSWDISRSTKWSRLRVAARKDSRLRFTSLLHFVDQEVLQQAFFDLRRNAAVGVDGVTWDEYEQNVEANIADLHSRVHRGAYRAKPSKRIWIPKPDGRLRPIGIAALEDKIVQQAVVWVLQCIYEEDFLGFSYGFRPNRSQHMALDALSVAITDRRVNWILDADIKGFFDNIDHQWMIRFLEHRIGDQRILRLIQKWLTAGISEDGEWSEVKVGTPQGAVISPLLANIFLHYAFDQWVNHWRKDSHGDVVVIRFADDFVAGFQHKTEAERFLSLLTDRLAKFGLELHPDKTRLLEFGRFANERRAKRGEPPADTFDFLGFTHICTETRHTKEFAVYRHTNTKRMRATLSRIKEQLQKRMHQPIHDTGRWLTRVVRGWHNYYGVPTNFEYLRRFNNVVARLWLRSLRRRSQKGRKRWNWNQIRPLIRTYLPQPTICHPYPSTRFRARLKVGAV